MRKDDLRNAIGGIRAREELVTETMDKIARYRTEQCESRGGYRKFGLGLRIACAACALVLMVGVTVSLGGKLFGTAPDTSDIMTARNDGEGADAPDTVSSKKELSELNDLASAISGDWMIVYATVDSCMMNENGGATVGITVSDFHAYSEGFEFDSENISAEIFFESQDELDSLINAMSTQRYLLLSCEKSGNEYSWTIEKYL